MSEIVAARAVSVAFDDSEGRPAVVLWLHGEGHVAFAGIVLDPASALTLGEQLTKATQRALAQQLAGGSSPSMRIN